MLRWIVDHPSFQRWLEAYGKAWESRDPQAAVDLFTKDATYQETPFAISLRGRDALFQYWSHVAETQQNIQFGFEILGVTDNLGFAHWWASFRRVPANIHLELNGVFVVALDGHNRCTALREWWHHRELSVA